MTNITVKSSIATPIQVDVAQIKHPVEDYIDNDTSFVVITEDGYELFKLLTEPYDISVSTPNGCYISTIEYDPLIIGSEVMKECIDKFLTSIRYSMHFSDNEYIKYKYDYLWYDCDNDMPCIFDDYLEFDDCMIGNIHIKSMSICHD